MKNRDRKVPTKSSHGACALLRSIIDETTRHLYRTNLLRQRVSKKKDWRAAVTERNALLTKQNNCKNSFQFATFDKAFSLSSVVLSTTACFDLTSAFDHS